MAELQVPQVDFRSLGDLGEIYRQNQTRALRERTLADLANGAGPLDYDNAARKLLSIGDQQGAVTLANLGRAVAEQQYQHGRDATADQFRRDEAVRAQANADRSFGLQQRQIDASINGGRVPAGFEAAPGGGLRPIAGGPEDPTYLANKTNATNKGQQFHVTDITKLTEEGQKFTNVTGFANSFEDRFGGRMLGTGDSQMFMGRHLPQGLAGKDNADAATWWQGYDKYKNVVRHDLYGGALTPNETFQFEKADITPTMRPEQIRKNLEIQRNIIQTAATRKAAALIEAGYDPRPIAAAYGVDLRTLGINPQRGATGTVPASASGVAAPAAPGQGAQNVDVQGSIANARAAIAADPRKRDGVIAKLRANGIDPALLDAQQPQAPAANASPDLSFALPQNVAPQQPTIMGMTQPSTPMEVSPSALPGWVNDLADRLARTREDRQAPVVSALGIRG